MTTRRDVIILTARSLVGAIIGANCIVRRGMAADENSMAEDPEKIRRWMDEWIAKEKPPVGLLHVGWFRDNIWYLTRSIRWTPDAEQKSRLHSVEVPVGFVTDFASIPRVFWSLLSPVGEYTWAAVIHDYLYWMQEFSRDEADEIFKYVMQDFHINSITASTIYHAVQIGGGSSWTNNAKLKANGEKRILKLYPPDPTVAWADWKKRTDVFASE